ncbi:4-hydroxy-tetrahydrodipicolinate synthase family protein [Streptomyces sp. NPDC020883]|uniref:4-hydroxy-tetrahydrodipicolinate synthase family protein n=1 Tax=unclassified Streptomyces TaxID=2593676 RepID=UPI0021B09BE5|nr:4-hydroxy-tetrahydrodipicolinate synthase [Streptomyces sp. BHT-5-2]
MELQGIYVPLVTPFAADGAVALDALESLAHSVLADGAAGLVALGTTGEPATLLPNEKRQVVEVCARVCREHRATLIVGAGGSDTRQSAAALDELAGVADAALVPVPPFVRPSEDGVLAHFAHLAERSPVPLVIYHIPHRTGQALGGGTLRRLCRMPGIVGAKLATGSVLDQDTVELLGDLPPGVAVLAGEDAFLVPLLGLGAAGGILASAHLATASFVELLDDWDKGNLAHARPLGHRLTALAQAVFSEPNPAVVKAVLAAQGRIPTPAVRLPLLPASDAAATRALARLSALAE